MPTDDPRPPLPVNEPPESRSASEDAGGAADPKRDDLATLRLNHSAMSRLGAHRIAAPSLDVGVILAERFTIVRFIARGGMGEVYEAVDLELNETVALKTIRPDIADDAMALSRFKREIQLARRVTHPNVLRMFDIFHHRWPPGAAGEGERLTFLTMELLSGETLHARVLREGHMSPASALVIVEQMTAALDAAHAVGVVHRDFKSANVILVPPGAPGERVRAVVTDFGLAYSNWAGAADRSALTTYGDTLGTPDYMAPEQVTGRPVTAAADIYALGIVLYEMMTGRRPFTSDSALTTAVRRLSEPPPSPRIHVADLDPLWEAVILRCLERDAEDRYVSANDVLTALTGGVVAIGKRAAAERRRRRTMGVAVGAVALLTIVLAGVLFAPALRRPAEPAPAGLAPLAPPVRRSVAVIGPENPSGGPETAWMSAALADLLSAELGAGETLHMVSGDTAARTKLDLGLKGVDPYSLETLGRIRARLGSDLVTAGSYLPQGGKVRLNLRVQDAASGRVIAQVDQAAQPSDIVQAATRAGAQLRTKLGLAPTAPEVAQGTRAVFPANAEAARLYWEGLARLRSFDATGARDLLQRAIVSDAHHAPAHLALASAWASLGYDARARAEARTAFDLSGNLSLEGRYAIEGRYRELAQDWDGAAATYSRLFAMHPDNVEYALRLARSQAAAAKGQSALATLAVVRKLPAPVRDDPRIDLGEADAAGSLSDFPRERAAAANAAAKGTMQDARLLVGQARIAEGWALRKLGQTREALAALHDARAILGAAGDRAGMARAIEDEGLLVMDDGQADRARELFQQAIAIRRASGDVAGAAEGTSNIGTILFQRGRAGEARDMYTQALTTFTEVGSRAGIARTQLRLGHLSEHGGDPASARKMYESARGIYRELNDENGVAEALTDTGVSLLREGKLAEAKKAFADAAAAGATRSIVLAAQGRLAHVLMLQGDLSAARTTYEETLSGLLQTGEKRAAAQTRVALARIAIMEGHATQAEGAARMVAAELVEQKRVDDQALALDVLARALLAQGKAAEAATTVARGQALAASPLPADVRLALAITGARAGAATGDAAAASAKLTRILAESAKEAGVSAQYETRLALGEVEMRSGRAKSGAARLQALEGEATARGFGLIARQAAAARSGSM